MFNANSKSGGNPHGPTLNGLVSSGADLLKQIYDVKIFFPDGSDDSAFGYPITVRAQGFQVPEVSVGSYDIKYHGFSVKRPNGNVEGDRQIELTFREDAYFQLRTRFSNWLMAVVDPVTGGISNDISYFGSLQVSTIAGEYKAAQMVKPTGSENGTSGYLGAQGSIIDGPDKTAQVSWYFYHVWVSKVGGVEFATDGSEANTFAVTFQYQDCDMPIYGGNELSNGKEIINSHVEGNSDGASDTNKLIDKLSSALTSAIA